MVPAVAVPVVSSVSRHIPSRSPLSVSLHVWPTCRRRRRRRHQHRGRRWERKEREGGGGATRQQFRPQHQFVPKQVNPSKHVSSRLCSSCRAASCSGWRRRAIGGTAVAPATERSRCPASRTVRSDFVAPGVIVGGCRYFDGARRGGVCCDESMAKAGARSDNEERKKRRKARMYLRSLASRQSHAGRSRSGAGAECIHTCFARLPGRSVTGPTCMFRLAALDSPATGETAVRRGGRGRVCGGCSLSLDPRSIRMAGLRRQCKPANTASAVE